MSLVIGKNYLVWGKYPSEYLGALEMGRDGLQHRFRRADGFGIICVASNKLNLEVQAIAENQP